MKYERENGMKIIKFYLLAILVLVLLASCSKPKINVLVVPTNKDAYCTMKLISTNWKGTKTIKLYDNNNNMTTCKATYRMTKDSLSCDGKEFNGFLTCFNNRRAELKISTTSCNEASGIAIGDKGDEYDLYIGLSDTAMKDKMDELDKIIKEQ